MRKRNVTTCLCLTGLASGLCLWCLVFSLADVVVEIPRVLRDATPVSDETRENLVWYLCASRLWRSDGVDAATSMPTANKVRWRSYHSRGKRGFFYRVDILEVRFSPDARPLFRNVWEMPISSASGADESMALILHRRRKPFFNWRGAVKRPICEFKWNNVISSQLELDMGNGVWIDVLDEAYRRSRRSTAERLDYMAALIDSAGRGREGLYAGLIADGSVKVIPGHTNSPCAADVEIGYFSILATNALKDVSGYINPGEPGVVSLAAYDPGTGVEMRQWGVDSGMTLANWTGWSTNANVFFYFRFGEIIFFEGDDALREARLELVFTPLNGIPATLWSTNCNVVTIKSYKATGDSLNDCPEAQ